MDQKNKLSYNEFVYKKTKDDCKLEDRFYKNAQFSDLCEITDKKTAYNEGEGLLYSQNLGKFVNTWRCHPEKGAPEGKEPVLRPTVV